MGVPGVLREMGHDPDPVLRGIGLSTAILDNPDLVAPFETMGKLLAAGAQVSACPHFGLLVGQQVPPSALGVLGFTVQNSTNVGTALANLIRYRDINDRGAFITLDRAGTMARLQYSLVDPDMAGADQVHDCAAAIACNILRGLCGQRWTPAEVLLARHRPAHRAPFERFFRCPVRFDSTFTGLLFDQSLLEQVPQGADPLLYRHLLHEARELHQSGDSDTHEAPLLLRTLLRRGVYGQEEVAALMGLSRRTLGRQLRSFGTTFRREVETVRFSQAKRLLAEANLNATQIASALGYADASAFSHAFRRWSGMSPGQWRARRIARW
jgi:AraC-like DNA-binding protein